MWKLHRIPFAINPFARFYYAALIYWTQKIKDSRCNIFSLQSIPFMHVKFYAGIECLRKLSFDAVPSLWRKICQNKLFSFVSSWNNRGNKIHNLENNAEKKANNAEVSSCVIIKNYNFPICHELLREVFCYCIKFY